MNECSVNGCTHPVHVKKRSLCRAHYMQWWKSGDDAKLTPLQTSDTCSQCGESFPLTHGSRRYCSARCRERAKYLRLCEDDVRYEKMLTRVRNSYERKVDASFYSNTCDDCGANFVELAHGSPSKYCSTTCAHRVAKRKRRAREHNATGEFSYSQVMRQYARQGHKCAYCKRDAGAPEPEHVLPLSRGGRNDMCNIVAACSRCNSDKSDRTLVEWEISRRERGLDAVDTLLVAREYRHLWMQEPSSPRWFGVKAA